MYNKIRNIACLALFVALAAPSFAAPRDKAAIMKAAQRTLKASSSQRKAPSFSSNKLEILKENEAFTVVGAPTGGYVIISNDDLAPEVIGYSESAFNDENTNDNFKWYLQAVEKAVKNIVAKGKVLKVIKPNPAKYPQKIESFVNVKWGQQDPYNRLCPTAAKSNSTPGQNYHGGTTAVTGCVATAMAQILRYNKYPDTGTGTKTLTVKQPDGSKKDFTVDFTQSNYRWNDMRDVYKKGAFSEEEAMAVATLMRDCGFAADMSYASDVSGTPINAAYAGLKANFKYPSTMQLLYRMDYIAKDAEWMDLIFKEISERRAIFYGASDKNPNNGGHAFVLCGYNEEGKVYVNWGWNGEDNGYYDVNLLNPSNYQFSEAQSMIIGLAPNRPARDKALSIDVEVPGTLKDKISAADLEILQSLTVKGSINSTDIKFLRSIAGCDEYGKTTNGALETIDLKDANIVSGGDPFLVDGNLTTANNEIPERAFFGCQSLRKIILPTSITKIGDGAFGKLNSIQEIVIPEGADKQYQLKNNVLYTKDATELIEVLPLATQKFTVDATVKKIHPYGFSGCQRLTDIIIPATVEKIDNNAFEGSYAFNSIRVYGKTPCNLGEKVFADINKAITKLYVPLHTEDIYKATEQWKEFFVDYDNILPFGTDIYASTATRMYGDENPEFGYRFDGDDFVGEPALSCVATPTSEVGDYEIKIARGTIESDMLQLFNGTLVITKAKATLKVDDKHINLGDAYTPTYKISGLKNGETTCTFTKEPTFIIKDKDGNVVTSFTTEGLYHVYVDGAEAKNYEFDCEGGYVMVYKDAAGIEEVNSEETDNEPYYTLGGVKVMKPAKGGIYIHKGKKVIIK